VLRSKPAGSLLYLVLPTLNLYLALHKSRNYSRCTHGVRYIYIDISMTTRMYIHARLQCVRHFDFPLCSGQIYGVDHERGNDFDQTDSDTLGVGDSCHRRGRPVCLVWPRPVVECSKVGVTTTTGTRAIVLNPSCQTFSCRTVSCRTVSCRVDFSMKTGDQCTRFLRERSHWLARLRISGRYNGGDFSSRIGFTCPRVPLLITGDRDQGAVGWMCSLRRLGRRAT